MVHGGGRLVKGPWQALGGAGFRPWPDAAAPARFAGLRRRLPGLCPRRRRFQLGPAGFTGA